MNAQRAARRAKWRRVAFARDGDRRALWAALLERFGAGEFPNDPMVRIVFHKIAALHAEVKAQMPDLTVEEFHRALLRSWYERGLIPNRTPDELRRLGIQVNEEEHTTSPSH